MKENRLYNRDQRNVEEILSEWGGRPKKTSPLTEEINLDVREIGNLPGGQKIIYHTAEIGDTSSRQVLISIALHGDEPAGIGAWWEVAAEIEQNPEILNGGLRVTIPSPDGRGRYLDGKDPNRVFNEQKENASDRLAHDLYQEMDRSKFVVDVHCGRWCAPFVIVDEAVGNEDLTDAASWAGARAVGCAAVLEMDGPEGKSIQNSLVTAARRRGVAGITIELPHRATPELAFKILHNALVGAGALNTETYDLELGEVPNGPEYRRKIVRSTATGYYRTVAVPGDWLNTNHPFAEIRKINGEFVDAIVFPAGYALALDKNLGDSTANAEPIGEIAELVRRME